MKIKIQTLSFFILILAMLLITGCGYQIKYALNNKDIAISTKPIPMKVQIATFSDSRDYIERQKEARKQKGGRDIGDYTYDKEFRGEVATEITKMLSDHLNYSRIFNPAVKLVSFSYQDISDTKLDSLQALGVDAVFTGEIGHFYGYYDRNIGRQLLYAVPLAVLSASLLNLTTTSGNYQITYYWYGPGLVLGYYLESLHKRQIEQRAQINAKLISTTSHQVVWQQNFDIFVSGKRNMPGVNTEQRKYQIALYSLRDAVNQLVTSLANNADLILKNKDQVMVSYQKEQPQPIEQPAKTPPIDVSQPLPPEQERRTKFGIIGGLNLANFSGDDAEDSKSKTGFAAGGFVTFNLSEKFAIQPEVLYSTKGSKYESSDLGFQVKATTSLNYIDIPVLGVFSPVNNIKFFAGPSINIFLNGKSEAEMPGVEAEMPGVIELKFSEDIKTKDVKSPEFGLVVGGAFSSGQLGIGARYSIGLTNQPKNSDVDLKNRVIQFMAGFSF